MPKPSIFSKHYDIKMKKRKKRIIFIMLIVVVFLIIILIRGAFEFNSKDLNQSKSKEIVKNDIVIKDNTINKVKDNLKEKKLEEKKLEEKNYIIKLYNGEEVKLSYNEVNGKKTYIKVEPKQISYSISPSKTKVVILENKTQNIVLIDENGNKKDITRKKYVSSRGTVFAKDSILNSKKDYIWCSAPKFLNEDNIVYISQLPWFNKKNIKYLWKYTISSNNHSNNIDGKEIYGDNIKYGKLSSEGLEVVIDGVNKSVK